MHLVHPLRNIYIYTYINTIASLAPHLIYTFTPVIATYKLCPYKINKLYVVSEYINNNSAVSNILLRSTVFSYPTSQYTAAIHCLQLSNILIYSCYPLSSATQHLNILLLSTVFSYPTSQYTAAIHCLQLSNISIYCCYPLSSAIQHINILLLSTVFSYPTSQYTAAIHCLQLSHISIYCCYPLSSAIQHLNILLLPTVFSYPTCQQPSSFCTFI